jgi:hypothetical protein
MNAGTTSKRGYVPAFITLPVVTCRYLSLPAAPDDPPDALLDTLLDTLLDMLPDKARYPERDWAHGGG